MEKKLRNAFDYAISIGSIEMFDLLAKDFDKFDQDDKNRLLRRTIQFSPSTELIQHVLNYGYDINFVDEDKNTLLHYAASSSYPATVRLFIQKGLDFVRLTSSLIDCLKAKPLLTSLEKSYTILYLIKCCFK